MSQAVIILEEEPLSNALVKWGAWMAGMVVFVMFLIYFSNYFATNSEECFIAGEYIAHPLQQIKDNRWSRRFSEVDRLTYI